MAGKAATLTLKIVGDASDAKRALDSTEASAGRFGGAMGKMGMVAGVAAAGIGVAVVGLKSLYDAADESRKIGALTTQVIKTTGGAAGVTAKQVSDLSAAIAKKTGVDDEAIQSGQNLLLTFTNVQNKAGAGNDIFNQATQIMTDMSVALGTDASASAIQLGKALNDPVKGVTALQKVGVSFTADQKEQIKTLVKHGDTLGAQKIILNELGKEFGGAAEAASTPLDRLKQRLGDVAETMGGALIPIVDKGAAFIGDKLMPAVSSLWNEVGPKLTPIITQLGAVITGQVIPAITGLWAEMGPKLMPIISTVGGFITGFLVPAFSVLWSFISTYVIPILRSILLPALDGIGAAFRTVSGAVMSHKGQLMDLYNSMQPFFAFIRDKVAPILGGVLKTGFEVAGKAIGAVVTVVAKLIEGIKWIIDKGASVGRFIGGLFGASAAPAGGALAGAAGMFGAAADAGGAWAPIRGASLSPSPGGTSPSAGRGLDAAGTVVNVTVNGALDPVAVGRQIDSVLRQYARTTGRQVSVALA